MEISVDKENIFARMRLPGSKSQLAIFRILLGMQILYSSSSQLFQLLQIVKGTSKPTIFPAFVDQLISLIAVPYLQTATQILAVFMIFGLFTRFILPVLFFTFLLLFSFWYSKFDAPVPWLYLWFPLLILVFSRSEDAFSLDKLWGLLRKTAVAKNAYRWPIEMICGWFAYIYFAAGIAKILPISKGFVWLDGATSQGIIYDRFLDSFWYYVFQSPIFDYTTNAWLFAALSIFALLIELFAVIIFFTNKANNLLIFLIISMHLFLYLVGVPGFMQIALLLSICMINPTTFDRLENLIKK